MIKIYLDQIEKNEASGNNKLQQPAGPVEPDTTVRGAIEGQEVLGSHWQGSGHGMPQLLSGLSVYEFWFRSVEEILAWGPLLRSFRLPVSQPLNSSSDSIADYCMQ